MGQFANSTAVSPEKTQNDLLIPKLKDIAATGKIPKLLSFTGNGE